jgi:predicted CoA-binding protein
MHANLVESLSAIAEIVRSARTVAVVGMQDEAHADRPAYTVPRSQQARGLEVIPVNPFIRSSLGIPALASVAELPRAVDIIQVFRRSDAIPALTDEILALPPGRRPKVVWLQSGIRHDASAERLAAAGILVVQDECLGVLASRYRR